MRRNWHNASGGFAAIAHVPGSWRIASVLGLTLVGCDPGNLTEIASGFDILELARPGMSEDGTVVVARPHRVTTSNGTVESTYDLAPANIELQAGILTRPVRVRNGGEVVFVGNRAGAAACSGEARGAYRVSVAGGPITTLHENCPEDIDDGVVGRDIALSPGGTVAFSQIRNGRGAIRRGPSSGPVSSFRTGTGELYNTGSIDVANSGRVAVRMEYVDGFAGGLMQGIPVFDVPEQPKPDMNTAIEKLGVGTQPSVAINASGLVAFSLNTAVTLPIGGTSYSYDPGVYISTPTLFNTPKALTRVAAFSDGFCRFGAVDINDAGAVVFEAAVDGQPSCSGYGLNPTFDGLFRGPDMGSDAIVVRGQSSLEGHQYFDSIYLGELNNAGQVSFTTTYSEPLVEPIKVWRWNP